MSHIVKLHDEELGDLYFEVSQKPETDGFSKKIARDSDDVPTVKGKITQLLDPLRAFAAGVHESVKNLGPDEIEVKAGMKVEFQEGVLIGLFAKARSEFPFEVTLKWKLTPEKNDGSTNKQV